MFVNGDISASQEMLEDRSRDLGILTLDTYYDGNPSLRAKISSSSHSQLIAFSALLVRSPKLPFIPLAASVAATDFKATRDGEVAE